MGLFGQKWEKDLGLTINLLPVDPRLPLLESFIMKEFYLNAQLLSPDAKIARQVMIPKITLMNIPSKVEIRIQVFFLSTPTKTNTNTIIEHIVHNQFQTVKPSKKN